MRTLNVTIAIGAIVALIGAGLVFAYGRSVEERIAEGKETVEVLVATADLEAGTPVEEVEGDAELRSIPSEYVAEGALASLDEMVALVLAGPVAEGAQLTESSFISPEAIAAIEPSEGNIALAVGAELSPGVARYVQRGSTVDVFVTYSNVADEQSTAQAAPPAGRVPKTEDRTKLFVSGVQVLAVTIAPVQTFAQDDDEDEDQELVPLDQVIAVLDVTPKQAEMIVNAATLGDIYLGLSTEGEIHVTPRGVIPRDVVRANRKR